MEQIKPAVSEEIDFELRDKKILKLFGIFGPSGSCCKGENQQLFNLRVCLKLKNFDSDLVGRNQTSTHREHDFENRGNQNTQISVRLQSTSILEQECLRKAPSESLSTTVELSIDKLM